MTAKSTQVGVTLEAVKDRSVDFIPDLSFHRKSANNASEGLLCLTVGGITTRLSGFRPEEIATLKNRYGIFCAETTSPAAIEIHVTRVSEHSFLKVLKPEEFYRVDMRWESGALLACSYEWAGWVDHAAGRGGLLLAGGTAADSSHDAKAFDRSIENFMRVVYAHAIISRGGFLLHSAGLVRGGRAYLFFGPSGSGKTTVTTLTPEALILSDDLTMVVRMGDGEYRACSVPFRGLYAPRPDSDSTWPVAGFFRLVQDTSDRLDPVDRSRAIGELVGSLPFVTERSEMAGDVIDVVAAATAAVPVFRLHFRKDRTFWDVVAKGCPGAVFGRIVDDFPAVGGT